MDFYIIFIILGLIATTTSQDQSQQDLGSTSKDLTPQTDISRALRKHKRSYYPWSTPYIQAPQYQSFSVWKPPVYQLSRPYYIPIFGSPGRIPIYFPPQAIQLNPGTPIDNPVRPFQGPNYLPPTSTSGPTYLPPDPNTEAPPDSTTMTINNRFNFDDDDAERPIWPSQNSNAAQRPMDAQGSVVPTRAPRPSRPRTLPPLVRNRTSVISGAGNSFTETELRPPNRNIASTQAPPPAAEASVQSSQSSNPSPCVWAIISCCSAQNNAISYNCFEQRGCHGAFWGPSPCDSEFARAAIASALNYYNSK